MITERRITIVIEDDEPNNIYPSSKESIAVSCDEVGFSDSHTFRTGNWNSRDEFMRVGLREIIRRLQEKYKL